MPLKQMRSWKALLLLLPALGGLPLASTAQPEAQQPAPPNPIQEYPLTHYQLQLRPDRDQLIDYNRGVDAFQLALNAPTPEKRAHYFECAERHLLGALDGPSSFPEATLALAHLYFTRNNQQGRMQPDAYRAAHVFAFLGGKFPLRKTELPTQGALRSEALTYLGILDLRGRRWAAAKQNFAEAMQVGEAEARKAPTDLTGETISLTTRGERKKMIAEWRARVARLECVNRVGSVMATYYMALHPNDPPPTTPNYRAVLDEINRLLPPDVVQRCESTFSGNLAAIWRFPERLPAPGSRALPFPPFPMATPDWTLTLGSPRPEGVEPSSVANFVRALRIWAGAELAPASPESPLPAAGLGPREQYNLGARLLRDLLDQEAKGNYQGALATADRLAELPNVRFELFRDGPNVTMPIAARQHRIWIRLDYLKDLAEADRLIHGAGANEDPDIWNEHFTLAERYLSVNNRAGAEKELREVLNGTATATDPKARAWQQKTLDTLKPLAAWNLAVLALNLPPANNDPAVWQDLLRTLPEGPYRNTLRFFGNLRLAEAYVRTGNPQQAEAALAAAEAIAALRAAHPVGVLGAADWLDVYRRHLAQLVLERNELERYRMGFLTKTSYIAEVRAFEAAEIWRMTMPTTDRAYDPILAKLQDALTWVDGNAYLRMALEADIAAVRDFQAKYPAWKKAMDDRAAILPVVKLWNEAADASAEAGRIRFGRATKDQAAAAWKAASEKWTAALQGIQALPPGLVLPMYGSRTGLGSDAEEAALHVVRSLLKVADAYIAAGDRAGARQALEAAQQTLTLPLQPSDKQLLELRINSNLRAIGGRPAAPPPAPGGGGLAAGPGRFAPYRGGPLRAANNDWAVFRTTQREMPNVERWLQRLRQRQDVRRALVHWCNEGPVARAAAARGLPVKRDFTEDSLMAFLEENISRTPGALRKGTTQWAMRPGRFGDWRSSPVRVNEASYNLKNGVQFVNAACTNAINAIVLGGPAMAPARPGTGRWIYHNEYLTWRHDPPAVPPLYPPRVEYSKPAAELPLITFSVYGYAWAPWVPSSVIIPPKFVPLVRSQMPPKLLVPHWWSIPPLCSPRRITIGRISSINDAHFPLAVNSGTVENKRRLNGSPRGAQDTTRKTPTLVPDYTPHPRKPLRNAP